MSKEKTKKNSYLAMTFRKKLAKIRKEHQLTQEEFAEKLGVSKSMVAYYETAPNPTLEAVQKVADFFKMSPLEFLRDENETNNRGPSTRLQKEMIRINRLSSHKQKSVLNVIKALIDEA